MDDTPVTLKRPLRQCATSTPNYANFQEINLEEEIQTTPRKRVKQEKGELRQEIIVASLKDDQEVPVYGYFTANFALKYRLDPKKAAKSHIELVHRMSPTFHQVEFLPGFGAKEKDIKDDIKRILKGKSHESQGM
jgi:hypothetical protein